MRRRRIAAAVLITSTAPALTLPATSAAAAHEKIRISSSKQIVSVGGFRPGVDASVRGAVNVFGPPSRVRSTSTSGTSCDIKWSERGLKITFVSFGSPGRSACEADIGLAQIIRIGGEKARGWHTNRGLYIRSKRSTMRKKYDAHRTGPGRYSLLRKRSIFGPPGTTMEVLGARIRNGGVSSFVLTPLAAGD
jgi:hypothetical protein